MVAKRVTDEKNFLDILISVWLFFPDFSALCLVFVQKVFEVEVYSCRVSLLLCIKTQKLSFYTSQPVAVSCKTVLVISNI